jgi:hypothetical protein
MSIENDLDLVSAGECRVWDVVTGDYGKLQAVGSGKASSSEAKVEKRP